MDTSWTGSSHPGSLLRHPVVSLVTSTHPTLSSSSQLPYNESTAQVDVLVGSFEWLGASLAVLLGGCYVAAALYLSVGNGQLRADRGTSPVTTHCRTTRLVVSMACWLHDCVFAVCHCVAKATQLSHAYAPVVTAEAAVGSVGFLDSESHDDDGSGGVDALSTCHHGLRHLAVIMDGNRRYGKRIAAVSGCKQVAADEVDTAAVEAEQRQSSSLRNLATSPLNGHRAGGEKLMEFIRHCIKHRITMLSVYAFSTENWSRSQQEIDVLMCLFEHFFEKIRCEARLHGIFIRFIATEPQLLPAHILSLMCKVEKETRSIHPRRITVNCCVSYGGRSEVVQACRRLIVKAKDQLARNSDAIAVEQCVTEAALQKEMLRSVTQHEHEDEDHSVVEDGGGSEPHVLLRTSGEARTSNFLLFETAYTELVFVNKTWPEVDEADLVAVIKEYGRRQRRFGK